MVLPYHGWNQFQQPGIHHRRRRVSGGKNMDFATVLRQVSCKAQGALNGNPSRGRKQITDKKDLQVFLPIQAESWRATARKKDIYLSLNSENRSITVVR